MSSFTSNNEHYLSVNDVTDGNNEDVSAWLFLFSTHKTLNKAFAFVKI